MKVVYHLDEIQPFPKPIALTIGTFDGVHLGHKRLLDKVNEFKGADGTSAVLTFSNHPYEVLSPGVQIPMLSTPAEKAKLFEQAGIDLAIIIEFTPELADMPYDVFVKKIRSSLPFSNLVLGQGATFGRNREGNQENLLALGEHLDFSVTYMDKLPSKNGEPISSKRVRSYFQMCKFKEAEELLGRPYFITLTPEKVKENTEELGDYALLCAFPNQARIPSGYYHIAIEGEGEGVCRLDAEETFGSDLPSYVTLFTAKPLDPEKPVKVNFIKPQPAPEL